MKFTLLSFSTIFLAGISVSSAQSLPAASPEAVGLSSKRLGRIDSVMNDFISKGKFPGMVALVARHGKVAYYKSFGKSDLETNKPMQKESMFRIASMTKAVTSVAIMTLYEEGHFLLTDPVSKYIPEFKNPKVVMKSPTGDSSVLVPAKSEITIRQLLNHTSGITYGSGLQSKYYDKAGMTVGLLPTAGTIKDKIKALGPLPLISHPGEEFHYGMSVDVLGYLVEVISGLPLDVYIRKRILEPLKMNDTYFSIPSEKFPRLASLYRLNRNGAQLEKVTKYFPYPAVQTYFAGGSGLVSTASDYSRFAMMLLNNGQLEGTRILGRKTIELMTSNSIGEQFIFSSFAHNGIMGDKFGLGFGLRTQRGVYDELESIGIFGWDGAFYTRFWVDPKEDLIAVFLSQVDSNWDEKLIGKFRVLVYQAIID